jgi:hypothetical protein
LFLFIRSGELLSTLSLYFVLFLISFHILYLNRKSTIIVPITITTITTIQDFFLLKVKIEKVPLKKLREYRIN